MLYNSTAANQTHYFGRVGVTYPTSYVSESGTSGDNCFADTDQVCNPGHAVLTIFAHHVNSTLYNPEN